MTSEPILANGVPATVITEMWPKQKEVAESLPEKPRTLLKQAISSSSTAPSGAVMLAASAIDAMLKDKGYKQGSLYTRIDKAAEDHLITKEMALWAHEVRLDANDQRHADENAQLPTSTDAQRIVEFAVGLTQFLYVLPSMVEEGRKPK